MCREMLTMMASVFYPTHYLKRGSSPNVLRVAHDLPTISSKCIHTNRHILKLQMTVELLIKAALTYNANTDKIPRDSLTAGVRRCFE